MRHGCWHMKSITLGKMKRGLGIEAFQILRKEVLPKRRMTINLSLKRILISLESNIFKERNVELVTGSDDPIGITVTNMYGRANGNDLMAQYDGELMDVEELNLMHAEDHDLRMWKMINTVQLGQSGWVSTVMLPISAVKCMEV